MLQALITVIIIIVIVNDVVIEASRWTAASLRSPCHSWLMNALLLLLRCMIRFRPALERVVPIMSKV